MAVAAEDPLFQVPWSVRTILQHFHIVVGLKHQHIGIAHSLQHQLGRVAKVGEKPDVSLGRAQYEADGILCVMGDSESLHRDIPQLKTGTCEEEPAIEFCFVLELDCFQRRSVAVHRDTASFGEGCQSLDVVTVLVSDQDAGEVFRGAPDRCKPSTDLPRAEPSVDQDPNFIGFYIGAIAARAAAENSETNCHRRTVVGAPWRRNAFPFLGQLWCWWLSCSLRKFSSRP